MGLKCEELPCPNHSSCQLWTLPLPIPFLRNSDCLVVEPVSLLLKEYALEHQINQDSYFQYFFTNLIKNSYLEAGWLAAEPLPYQKNDQALVVCFIVISNKNETLDCTIIANNLIKSTIGRSIHSSSL